MPRMADEAPEAAPKKALADPIEHPGGPREAMDSAEKLQKRPLKGIKRPQKASKKASGDATSDHGGSRRLKEGLLEAKNHPRRPAGGQESPKKACWSPRFLKEAVLVPFWGPFWGPVLAHVRFQNRVQIWVNCWCRFFLNYGPKK